MQPAALVGRRLNLAGLKEPPAWADIVGVVRDVRLRGPESLFLPAVYVPYAREPIVFGVTHVVIKAGGDPRALVGAIRQAAARVDPNLPLYDIRTFDDVRAAYLAERRFAMTMMLAFGALAFGLAAVGLYGVINYLVQLRTREIGIRMAIGASPAMVRREVLANGLRHAIAGIAIGAAVAIALSRAISASLPGLGHVAPSSLAWLACAVVAMAAAATWLPALRATRVDPMVTLRAE
jgi:ABC-type antimicrobial peptide transport system permease subunit